MRTSRAIASYRVIGTVLAVGLSCSGSASAQTADTNDQSEIIVTAQRRAQSARDVGITMTVATADAIRTQRIQEVANLPQLSPNVAVKENIPGLVPVITIRGVGLNDFSATNSPSAGVYVDDVYLG